MAIRAFGQTTGPYREGDLVSYGSERRKVFQVLQATTGQEWLEVGPVDGAMPWGWIRSNEIRAHVRANLTDADEAGG